MERIYCPLMSLREGERVNTIMEEIKQIDEEVKKEILKHKLNTLSDVMVNIQRKQNEMGVVGIDTMIEVLTDLENIYGQETQQRTGEDI